VTMTHRGNREKRFLTPYWGFVAPALLFLIALNLFPLVYDVVLGFTDAELSGGQREWVGGRNYERVFGDPEFAAAIRTTAKFVAVAVGAELLLGFGLALCLRDRFPGKAAVLTLLLLPMMLSPAVMGLYWNLVLQGDYGVLNQALRMVGVARAPGWLTDPDLKFWAIVLVDVWMWTPFMMLIAMAGLNAIPRHLYEAAEIDRAPPFTVFRRITLPLCAPLLLLAVLLRTTDALKQFDLVMALTGPNDASTQTLSALLYQTMFRGYKLGLGSAYSCVVLVGVIALASLFVRYLDRLERQKGRVA